jgi:hypothetical protein
MAPNPPTGQRSSLNTSLSPLTPWSYFAGLVEDVPELQWPRSIPVYRRMLKESRIQSLYSGTVLPILNYDKWIDPNGCDSRMVDLLAEDLGLPLGDKNGPAQTDVELQRLDGRFDFDEHLQSSLKAVPLGFAVYEQVNEYVGGLYRMRKLLAIPQSSIPDGGIVVDLRDGSLQGVKQNTRTVSFAGSTMLIGDPPVIPANRLLWYPWDPEDEARWIGSPMLRSLYGHWLCKDVLMRVDLTNHRRAGGVPVIETDDTYQGASMDDLASLAQAFKVDEEGGAALPPGASLKMVTPAGDGTAVVGSMRWHDEQMAQVWHEMVSTLATKGNGARALGDTLQDSTALFRRAIVSWWLRTFNRYQVGDWWAWNVDPEATQRPIVRMAPPSIETSQPDPAVVGGVPPTRAVPQPRSPLPAVTVAASRLPDRPLRRKPYEHELRAAVDFQAVDTAFEQMAAQLDTLFLQSLLPDQIAALGDAIVYTKAGTARKRTTAADLSKIKAPVVGAARIAEVLGDMVKRGADMARTELADQGLEVPEMSNEQARALAADHAAAVAQQLADGVSIAGSRKAVQMVGTRTAVEVANEVRSYIGGLTHQWERDQLQGAVAAAQGFGRFAIFDQVPGGRATSFYISALLDGAACSPCIADDGRTFHTVDEMRARMPSGGNAACLGGPRCRCVGVAVLEGETL